MQEDQLAHGDIALLNLNQIIYKVSCIHFVYLKLLVYCLFSQIAAKYECPMRFRLTGQNNVFFLHLPAYLIHQGHLQHVQKKLCCLAY